MSTSRQKQNEHLTLVTDSIGSPPAWYSRTAFLVTVRVAQFVSSITAVGLLATLFDTGYGRSFELAVSVISSVYLIVIASAPLPLNIYSLIAVFVFETAIFALWVAASATLGDGYGNYTCTSKARQGGGAPYSGFWSDYYRSLFLKQCKVGKASIAIAALSAFLSLCAFVLLCVNVLMPLKAVSVGQMNAEDNRAHLSRFTALAFIKSPPLVGDIERACPVEAEVAEPVVLVDAQDAEPVLPVNA
ncbi:uncharacterized protein LALA0_S06e00100g [Lachancea lanzarotensis]|uniref:LALA0S06e00100g1_1 n=1 Tax=Lachancea lanzarotensis TaxID=1245769 RepID=A0A0C7MY45_9SACH|nr:uncharacterized protein LALA0_S06e00100g [Lachancea lanzarotensis]CEP62630.1 LALA0S06e00100g1_1 [Lachancea lanzarotensis]